MDIAAWLRNLGLERYAPAFAVNDIDASVLPTLTGEDLQQLGVSSVGHRRKLLDAIAALRGASAAAGANSPAATAASRSGDRDDALPTQAERRHLTVLICDLVGSTQMSTQLDPEDLSRLLAAYRSCCAEVVARWDGYVAKFLGDGVLAYFGWPKAHEDDAECAVRAGLDLIAAIDHLVPSSGARLAARVGIATGEVVVGDLIGERDAQEHSVVGETPNLAARLQSLAQPGAVVIEPHTRRLLGTLFELRDLGPSPIKGFAAPVATYEVLRASGAESRFEALHAQQTLLVGRDEEISLLLRRWEQAKQSEGQVVLLSGEPGIGKSRTSATLLERLADEVHVRLRYFCSPHHASSPLHPFVAQLERAAGFSSDEPPQAKFAKLVAALVPSTPEVTEDAALLAELLSIPPGEHYRPLALSPEQKKERTLKALLAQLKALAATKPVLMLFEDLHWIDPTSRELLEWTVDSLEQLPVLLVATFRPEFQPPWLGQSHVSMHMLRKLNRRESIALIDRVAGGKALPAEVAEQIIAHTDGVPLFIEELTKTVLEGNLLTEQAGRYVLNGPLPPVAIPNSLQASLLARLDRLASLKDVAQIGAAIGREFPYELLAAVAGRSEADLQSALDQLVEAGLLFRRGTPPRASLMFKHALVQDAAYASLLRSRRQELHARIAGVLEEKFPDIVETQPELLAQHYTQAALAERASVYWQRAGERALARSANLEAIQHFSQGIELVKALPLSPERNRQELRLYLGLGPAIRAIKGHSAPETLRAFSRARELIDEGTDLTQQLQTLYGFWGVQFGGAELQACLPIAAQVLDLVARTGEAEAHALANRMMGETLWAMGRFDEARHYLERAIDFCAADQGCATKVRFTLDNEATALTFLAYVLCSLGYPEKAEAAAARALVRSTSIDHTATFTHALYSRTHIAALLRDTEALHERATADIAYCTEHGFVGQYMFWGRFNLGLAQSWGGDPAAGIGTMHTAAAASETVHAILWRPMNLGCLAEVHASIGEIARAHELLDEAIALVTRTNERTFEPELYRLRGELFGAQDQAEAETSFGQALAIARQQNAKLWELRAGVSLAKLWQKQGQCDKARDLLAPIYNWFTEGSDTPDLKAAKELLDALRSAESHELAQ